MIFCIFPIFLWPKYDRREKIKEVSDLHLFCGSHWEDNIMIAAIATAPEFKPSIPKLRKAIDTIGTLIF
ncbi:MAG: hypothetical protein J7647_32460 [Cyanobacteria bacterium SBLK]|nr:hypothetical protein [Cyanobacteria bacterium SBLK]